MTRTMVWATRIFLLIAAGAIDARAQMTMGTFKGYLTGHVGAVTSGDVSNERLTAGASVAVHETSGWGAEVDFGRATAVDASRQVLDLTTYFVNAAWAKPRGIVRPFAIVGAGIVQTDGCFATCASSTRTYDLGFDAGGGTFLAINDVAGLRADVRYLFTSSDHPELLRPGNFAYWRVSVGATFMWDIVP